MTPLKAVVILLLVVSIRAQDSQVACPPASSSVFVRRKSTHLVGTAEKHLTGQTLGSCMRHCAHNEAAGIGFGCAAFDFLQSTGRCYLSSVAIAGDPNRPFSSTAITSLLSKMFGIDSSISSGSSLRYDNQPESGFYWRICVTESAARNSSVVFEQVENMVLSGSSRAVLRGVGSVDQCLQSCLNARIEHGFACRSVMYYYNNRDCLLNTHDRSFRSITDEDSSSIVDYFENVSENRECLPGKAVQYMRVERQNVDMLHDSMSVLDVTLDACQHICTSNRLDNTEIPCEVFQYDAESRECFVFPSKPEMTRGEEFSSTRLFQKICLDEKFACLAVPTFVKVPQHSLDGFVQMTFENITTEEECLSRCLGSRQFNFDHCLSVNYYHDSFDCLLNFETRAGLDEQLTNKTYGHTVSYYDNMCAIRNHRSDQSSNTACPSGKQSTYLAFAGMDISSMTTESFGDVSRDDCFVRCEASVTIPCHAVRYHADSTSCTLANSNDMRAEDEVEVYQRHCIESVVLALPEDGGLSTLLQKRASLFNLEIGIQCGIAEPSFKVATNVRLVSGSEAFLSISGISLEECLGYCLHDPAQSCKSVNYIGTEHSCEMNNETLIMDVNSQKHMTSNNYENLCYRADQNNLDVVADSILRHSSGIRRQPENFELSTQCEYGHMRVIMQGTPTDSGHLFAKNKFDTCRTDTSTSTSGTELILSFPYSDRDCGVVETAPNIYSTIVVLTKNNLGVPGLVTDQDRFFNITCDYSLSTNSKVTAQVSGQVVSNPGESAKLQPGGRIDIPSPVSIRIRRGAQDVENVVIGERLTLNFDKMAGVHLGVFIKECNASRVHGTGPDPSPLSLIRDGCPVPAVQSTVVTGPIEETSSGYSMQFSAFRFDGSKSVKISCAVDICESGSCNPTSCNINDQRLLSFGRRKRSTGIQDSTTQTAELVFSVASSRSQDNVVNNGLPQWDQITQRVSSNEVVLTAGVTRFCLKKGNFIGIFLFLSSMCAIQISFIMFFLYPVFSEHYKYTDYRRFFFLKGPLSRWPGPHSRS